MQSAWWRAAAGLTVGVVLACGMAASALPAPADEETTGGAGDSGGRMPSVAAFPGDGPGPAPVRARDRQAPAETPFPVVEGRWKPLANYPTRIVDHEVVLVDDTWYAVGGSDGWQSDATVRAYDPVGRAWRSVADLPAPRHAAAVAAVEGGIVVSGGWTPEADTAVETYTYDTGSDTWSQGADNPFAAVSAAGTAVLDGRLYSVGGCTTGACLPVSALVTVYDPSTDSWARLADYPLGVAFPSCGGIDGRVYCSGGVTDLDETSQEATARSFVYDPTDDTWSPVADAPAPTWAAADTVAIGMLFTVGGVVDGVPSAKARSYDPGTDTWVDQPDLPFAVHRGAAACGLVQVGGVFLEPIDTAWFLPGYDGCPGGAVALMADRISGADRYGTAAAVSQRFGPGVETVFVVTGRNYPDALAAAARAGSLGAPVLLTRPGSLPGATSRELSVRDPEEVVVVGGTEAVHDRVLEAIEEVVDARVRRIAGGDRYATAADVAAEFDTADTVFVATGLDYPDALAGASRAGALDAPVLLVRTDSVPAATRRELERLRPDRIVLLGGPVAVTTGVEEELGGYGSVTRVAGTDRYRTAAALAGAFPAADSVYAASGQNWPDALAGAALAGHEQAPILLVRQASLPGPTRRALERLEPGWVGVVGGPVAVGEQVLAELRELR